MAFPSTSEDYDNPLSSRKIKRSIVHRINEGCRHWFQLHWKHILFILFLYCRCYSTNSKDASNKLRIKFCYNSEQWSLNADSLSSLLACISNLLAVWLIINEKQIFASEFSICILWRRSYSIYLKYNTFGISCVHLISCISIVKSNLALCLSSFCRHNLLNVHLRC